MGWKNVFVMTLRKNGNRYRIKNGDVLIRIQNKSAESEKNGGENNEKNETAKTNFCDQFKSIPKRHACCVAGSATKWSTNDPNNGECICVDPDKEWNGKTCVAKTDKCDPDKKYAYYFESESGETKLFPIECEGDKFIKRDYFDDKFCHESDSVVIDAPKPQNMTEFIDEVRIIYLKQAEVVHISYIDEGTMYEYSDFCRWCKYFNGENCSISEDAAY